LDILGAGLFGGGVAFWENRLQEGLPWEEHVIVSEDFYGAVSVFAADMDADGDLDVLSAGFSVDDITWWENAAQDGSEWVEHVVDGGFDGAQSVFAADINGDESTEVVGAAYKKGEIAWWERSEDSGATWTKNLLTGELQGAYSVQAADINHDGAVDILAAAFESNEIVWWENPGEGNAEWIEHVLTVEFEGAYCVYAADLNGDEALDIVGAAGLADAVTWWENIDGSGSAWTEHTVKSDFDGASFVRAKDLNNDGKVDLVGAAEIANSIVWWENNWF
jgi:hypothetical protein